MSHIELSAHTRGGKPRITGTRITVADIVLMLKTNVSREVIVETKDIREATEQESPRLAFSVIEEQELLEKLSHYENLIGNDATAYVGLKHFVTSVLGRQGYEINHSYAILNDLIDRGIVKLYEKKTELWSIKAISLRRNGS
jgi:uncharacterized protein (DUF433 family)